MSGCRGTEHRRRDCRDRCASIDRHKRARTRTATTEHNKNNALTNKLFTLEYNNIDDDEMMMVLIFKTMRSFHGIPSKLKG